MSHSPPVPMEAERELLSGAFAAVSLLDGEPRHEEGRSALEVVRRFPVEAMAYREHRQLLEAIQAVLGEHGTLSPALVLEELRRRGQTDAIRLLPSVVTYGGPVLGLRAVALVVWQAAGERRRLREHQDEAAEILAGVGADG